MKKRSMLITVLLALAMIATFMPMTSFASEGPGDRVEFNMNTFRTVMPNWDGDIDNSVRGRFYDAAHPDGEFFEADVTKVSLVEGQSLIDWDGEFHYRSHDWNQNPYGTAKFNVSYDYNGKTYTYVYKVIIVKDYYDIWFDAEDGRWEGIPGDSFNLIADRQCETVESNGDRHDIEGNFTTNWSIAEGSDFAVITPDKNDPYKASLKFKTVPALGDKFYNNFNESIKVKLELKNGTKVVDTEYRDYNIHQEYTTVYPQMVDNPGIGETKEFVPEIRMYDVFGTQEQGYNDENYRVIPSEGIECQCNSDAITASEKGGKVTITRNNNDWAELQLKLWWHEEDGALRDIYTWYHFDSCDYGIYHEGDESTNDGHDINFYTDADPIPAGVINMEKLGADPEKRFDIRYRVGNWNGGAGDEGTWSKEYSDKDYSVTYNGGKAYIKLNENLLRGMDWNDIRVEAKVFVKGTDNFIADTDLWFHVMPAKYEYRLPEYTDMLPGWDNHIDGRVELYIENAEYPQGKDFDLEVTSAEIAENHPKSGGNVISLQKADDGWDYRAENYGDAKIRIKYKDYDGSIKTHEFIVEVKDTVYNINLNPADGYWRGLPGASINMEADVRKEFVCVDENDPEHWWQDSTQENLKFNWSIIEGNEFATIKADPNDQTKATVTFRKMPDGWDSIGEKVLVRLSIDDGASKDVISRIEDLYVEDEFYRIYPGTINAEDFNIGDTISFTPELRFYRYDKTGYKVIKNAKIDVGSYDPDAVKATVSSTGKVTLKRLKAWGGGLQLIAEFKDERGEDRDEDQWINYPGKAYMIWFEPRDVDIYNARTMVIEKSDDLKKVDSDNYDIYFDVEVHNGKTDTWRTLDESAYSVDVRRNAITIYSSKISEDYDSGTIRALLDLGGDGDVEWEDEGGFNLLRTDCPNHVMKTESKNATKTETGYTRKYCETCGEEQYTFLKKLNSMTVTASTKTVKYAKVRKKAQTVAPLTVKNAAGKVTYTGKGTTAKAKKALKINKTTGKITVKKGTKKGTYKMKVTVRDAGTSNVRSASKTKTVIIKVK